jgi:4'-phosphopantetheinyl transferase
MEQALVEVLQPIALDAGIGIDVYVLELDALNGRDDAVHAQLTAEEQRRAERFANGAQARLWAGVRACLRLLLASRQGCRSQDVEFTLGQHGKPASQAAAFNVSHSGSIGLIALSAPDREQPGSEPKNVRHVGVDVEAVSTHRDVMELATLVCTPAEREALSQLAADQRPVAFTRLWSRKEAWLKAYGVGLGFGATRVHVDVAVRPCQACVDGVEDAATLIDLPLPDGYLGSLCVSKTQLPPAR